MRMSPLVRAAERLRPGPGQIVSRQENHADQEQHALRHVWRPVR